MLIKNIQLLKNSFNFNHSIKSIQFDIQIFHSVYKIIFYKLFFLLEKFFLEKKKKKKKKKNEKIF